MPSLSTYRRRFAQWFFPCGQCYPRNQNNHMAAPVKVARQQTTPELSGTFQTLYTLRNPPEPSETFRNQPFGTFRNLPPKPTHTPEPSKIFRNLPELVSATLLEPASGTYTSIRRNPPEPSGTCLRNLHQHTPELSGTFRNLPPEPAPATRTGTHRSLSGLKTPLAYAVGEKQPNWLAMVGQSTDLWNLPISTTKSSSDQRLESQPAAPQEDHRHGHARPLKGLDPIPMTDGHNKLISSEYDVLKIICHINVGDEMLNTSFFKLCFFLDGMYLSCKLCCKNVLILPGYTSWIPRHQLFWYQSGCQYIYTAPQIRTAPKTNLSHMTCTWFGLYWSKFRYNQWYPWTGPRNCHLFGENSNAAGASEGPVVGGTGDRNKPRSWVWQDLPSETLVMQERYWL